VTTLPQVSSAMQQFLQCCRPAASIPQIWNQNRAQLPLQFLVQIPPNFWLEFSLPFWVPSSKGGSFVKGVDYPVKKGGKFWSRPPSIGTEATVTSLRLLSRIHSCNYNPLACSKMANRKMLKRYEQGILLCKTKTTMTSWFTPAQLHQMQSTTTAPGHSPHHLNKQTIINNVYFHTFQP